MKLNNVTEIRSEDFENDFKQLASQLGNILNPFMQQVVEIMDGRIDFENRVENFIQVEFTLDANGIPLETNKINTGKSNIRGFQVVSAFNLTNNTVFPTSQPFINYTPLGGTLVQINKITGLPAGNKFRLNIEVK